MRLTRIIACSVLLVVSLVSGQWLEKLQPAASSQPGFGLGDVVGRVWQSHAACRTVGLDAGEFLLDTGITYGPAPSIQAAPAVGFDGVDFLVVWEDQRGGDWDIWGARVTSAGTVLDSAGFVIAVAAGDQRHPAVAFDGTVYLVVWTDRRGADNDIRGARVRPTGVVLDPAAFVISSAGSNQEYPTLTFDGANFMAAWEDDRNGSTNADIYGARVTHAGVVLDPNGLVISSAPNHQYYPRVSSDGTNSLVVWQDWRKGADSSDIYGARVTPSGTVLDPSGFVISGAAGRQCVPASIFDGVDFLVVWQEQEWEAGIIGVRVTPAGTVLDSQGIVISAAPGGVSAPTTAFDGTNCLVAWVDKRNGATDIYGARVSLAGTVLDTAGIPICQAARYQRCPVLASSGSGFFAAWWDIRSGDGADDIYGARVTTEGYVLDSSGVYLSMGVNAQSTPSVASDGANLLVAWEDLRTGSTMGDIYGARVTASGTVLDTSSFPIAREVTEQWSPAVSFDGQNYLVAWTTGTSGSFDVYAARVSPAGAVLDSGGFPVSAAASDQESPVIAFDGTNSLVVWQDWRSLSMVYGARVTPSGAVLDTAGFCISSGTYHQTRQAVGFGDSIFLVAWSDYRSRSFDIYGARVTPAAVVLDPSSIQFSSGGANEYCGSIAFDGTNFLVVWADTRSGSYDIYGARVAPSGAVLDPSGFALCQSAGDQSDPACAFDGSNYLVVWQDGNGSESSIYGTRVTPQGTVFDGGPVVTQEGFQGHPVLARGPSGQVFLVYEGWAGTVGGRTYNAMRIWGKSDPSPISVEEGPKPTVRYITPVSTIVHGILRLPVSPFAIHTSLLDMTGRQVMALRPGANDVRPLAPGVYFVRSEPSAVSRKPSAVTKVVLTR